MLTSRTNPILRRVGALALVAAAAVSLTACASPRSEAGQVQDSEFIKTHVHPVQITDLDGNTVNCVVYDDYTGSSGGAISCEWVVPEVTEE